MQTGPYVKTLINHPQGAEGLIILIEQRDQLLKLSLEVFLNHDRLSCDPSQICLVSLTRVCPPSDGFPRDGCIQLECLYINSF